MFGSADWNDMLADLNVEHQETIALVMYGSQVNYHNEEEDEDNLTYLEYCDRYDIDLEEQMAYEKADMLWDSRMDR